MMAMMFVASATAFAGDSDALKAITKTKNYDEAAQLVHNTLGQLADNGEKAKAYNHLVDLAMKKVDEQVKIADDNLMAIAQNGKVTPLDTLALCDNLCLAILNAAECNKYDQLPNAKGKVAPKYDKKNAQRLWQPRGYLAEWGDKYRVNNEFEKALYYWKPFLDSYVDPMYEKLDKYNEIRDMQRAGVEQVAYLAAYCALKIKDVASVQKYANIANKNEKFKTDVNNWKILVISSDLKTPQDTTLCINNLKSLYESEPENEVIVSELCKMYEMTNNEVAEIAFLDAHLAKFPHSYSALASKGFLAGKKQDYAGAVDLFKKAVEAAPQNAIIRYYLAEYYMLQATSENDVSKGKTLLKNSIDSFDKVKELDPDKQMIDWGYKRYQAYYALYGENDPKTKDAEYDK